MALFILVLLFQLEERWILTQYSTSGRCVCLCMCVLTDPQSTAGTATHSTSLLKRGQTSSDVNYPARHRRGTIMKMQISSWSPKKTLHIHGSASSCVCLFATHDYIQEVLHAVSAADTSKRKERQFVLGKRVGGLRVQIWNDGLGYYSYSVFSQDWLNLRSKLFSEARLV